MLKADGSHVVDVIGIDDVNDDSRRAANVTDRYTQTEKQPPDAPRKDTHELLLELLDIIVSCVLVAPCVIAYWRGTWELMGVLLFPRNMPLSALASFVIGGIGHFVFTMTQHAFRRHIHPDRRRLSYYVVSRLYTAIFGVVCVNMWRGCWVMCDWLTSADSLVIICVVTTLSVIFLLVTRTVRNLGAAPYAVTVDHKSDYFDINTMFRIEALRQPGLFMLDTVFSIFVIGTLVVVAWRGLWGILDLTLYPANKSKSSWGSLVIGYLTIFATFVLQPMMRFICRRTSGVCKLLLCDFYYLMTFFGAVNAWRGIWNLLDIYIYPDNKIMSYWLTHVIPFLLLAALKCSNTILVRGVFIDAEEPGADAVAIPINYLRLHFRRERLKKAHRHECCLHGGYQEPPLNEHLPFLNNNNNNNDSSKTSASKKHRKKRTPEIRSGMDARQIV